MHAMKVILLSDLHQVGRRGDEVEAKPGYARNYLLPKGLAVRASDANRKWFEHQSKKIDARNAAELDEASMLAAKLDGTKITIAKRAGETERLYGSVTPSDITEALVEKGYEIERRQVDLAGGIKDLGEHQVRILLHADVAAQVMVIVEPEE